MNIHPHIAELSLQANNRFVEELIEHLNKKDCGRVRTKHQSTIDEIVRFRTNFQLGAEQYLPRKKRRKGLIVSLLVCAAVFLLAWTANGSLERRDQVLQENLFFDPLKGTPYEGQDYYPPEAP